MQSSPLTQASHTNPIYQWYVNTGSGWTPAVGARYQGANTATLTVVSVLEMMSGYQYMVRVSGICTPYIESIPVTLTVTRQAEITQHPVSLTLCEGQPAVFTVNAGLTTNPSYQWEISSDGGMTWAPVAGANYRNIHHCCGWLQPTTTRLTVPL
ncbi:MAG: hypothetical protein MZV63_47260 [Marinilabiliales bacterium]|nr:hypothetical protein [Marinilabiliales bacterium]